MRKKTKQNKIIYQAYHPACIYPTSLPQVRCDTELTQANF